jgi:ArsR family transcriptional regulator
VNRQTALTLFETLSSGLRLDIYRLLMRQGPQGLVAGEIAALLELPASNTSFHLKAMTHSGLLLVTQEGRFQRYRANMDIMLELVGFLTEECCSGQPELCRPAINDKDVE